MKRIPEAIWRQASTLFWDIDASTLDPVRHEDFIVGRVLSKGDLETVRSLREELGDDALRAFIARASHRLDRRSQRFFEVVLSIAEASCNKQSLRRSSAPLFRP